MGGEWQDTTIGEIASSARNSLVGGPFGSNLVSRDYADHGVPVIRGQNMDQRWIAGAFVYVTPEKADALRANLARPGDIVFTQRGTLGQVSLVPEEPYALYLVSQSQMKLTVNAAKADHIFIYYACRSPQQREIIRQNAIQAGVPHINLGILRGLPIRLPPLGEQRAIAKLLGTLDDKIELNRQMNETLEAMAQALFKSWFVDFDPVHARAKECTSGLPRDLAALFPKVLEASELGEIPAGWKVVPIGELATIVGGSTPSTKEPLFWNGGVHHWVTPKDLSNLREPVLLDTERKITDLGLAEVGSGLLPVGTVLLSSRAPIGYLAIAEIPVAINQGFIAMIPRDGVSNLFLLSWARWAHEQIVSRANGSTFLEISKSAFRPIQVICPPFPIFGLFERMLQPLYSRVVVNLRESLTVRALRDTLLPKLISGALRVQDAERIVERHA